MSSMPLLNDQIQFRRERFIGETMLRRKKQESLWAQKIHVNASGERLQFRDISDHYLKNIINSTTFLSYDKAPLQKELRAGLGNLHRTIGGVSA
jgi:hypothetical protein